MKRTIAALTLAIAMPIAAAAAFTAVPDDRAIALVKSTTALKIDSTQPASDAYPAKTNPWVNVVTPSGEGPNGGYLLGSAAHQGALANGTYVIAIPLASGGTGDIFTQIVFSGTNASQVSYTGYLTSEGHLDVQIVDGAIAVRYPKYGPDDPQCCASHYVVAKYDVSGGKLHKVSETVVAAPKH